MVRRAFRAAGPLLRLGVVLGLVLSCSAAWAQATLDGTDWTARLAAEEPEQRRAAIHALADLGGLEAVELLAARLEHESDDDSRRAIHDALLRIQLDEVQLTALLADGGTAAARAFAAHSLGNRHSQGSVTALLKALRDPEPVVRREVYEALGSSGDRTVIQELIKAAVRETSPPLREQAEQAAQLLASQSGRPREVLVAISMLQGGKLGDQLWAIEVLAESGDWRALQVLLDTAHSAAPEVQREAIKALGMLGDHRAVPALHTMLDTHTGRTRHYVIGALALLGDEASLEPLARLVGDPDPASRVLAIRALGALGHPGAAERILPALEDPEEPVRTEAIHALGRHEGTRAVPGLTRALEDPSPFLRAEAARLLAMTGVPGVDQPLLALLDDRDPLVRLTSAEGLALLGAEEALPRIEQLAEATRDDDERAAYERAAARLRGSNTTP
jgi:HEAT repeat protein